MNLMDSLMARLEVIGEICVDDLNFVKTEDINGILPPIQCRRLIQVFSSGKCSDFLLLSVFISLWISDGLEIFWHCSIILDVIHF